MFSKTSISSRNFLRRLALNAVFCLGMLGLNISLQAEEKIIGYATPKNPYTFIYPLNKVHTTTLFRSEKFEPLAETPEGYIVSLNLEGKQNFVLLPFENKDRKVAEQKFKGVGVNYTAYLTFAQAFLPFYRNTYYEVLEIKEDTLTIDYKLKGFRKIVEVPIDEFKTKTAFEYKLDEALEVARTEYSAYNITSENPKDWDKVNKVKPHSSPFQSTHLGVVENADIGINLDSSRWITTDQLPNPLDELEIKNQALQIFPIAYTWEVNSVAYHFIRINKTDRPALIKEFKVQEGEEGYHKFIELEAKDGESSRLLEITKNTSIEIIEDTTFFIPGTLVAVAKVQNDLPIHTKRGVYRGYNDAFKLYTPKEFLNTWTQRTEKNDLTIDHPLFIKFLDFPFPPALTSENGEWSDLREIQKMAIIYSKFIKANRNSDFKSMIKYHETLERTAKASHVTLNSKPTYSKHPHRIRNFHAYWKRCSHQIFALAAHNKQFDVIKFQLLKFKVLEQEVRSSPMREFISDKIYAYKIYMPVPLNKVSQLEIDTYVAKTDIMIWGQSIDELITLDSIDGNALELNLPSAHKGEAYLLKPKFNHSFLLPVEKILSWYAETSEFSSMVRTQKYWEERERSNLLRLQKLEDARQQALDLQATIEQEELSKTIPDSAWVAIAAWLVLLLVVNCAFVVLLRGFPSRSPSPQLS